MSVSVAVVGAGMMGRNHLRVYRELPEAHLVAVSDADEPSATRAGMLYGTRPYVDFREMLERERPQAVSVVVPTEAHFAVAQHALEFGCHVLVEKPLTSNLPEAAKLVMLAESRGLVLGVGHVERFNPAVVELKARVERGELGRVFQIGARRLGPFPARVQDVGVVVDLATHDLDIMRYLTGHEAIRVHAETKREIHSSREDLLTGMIRFDDDTVGVLEINWLTPTKIRELWVTGDRGVFRADYLTQDLYFFENAHLNGQSWSELSLRGVTEGMMMRFPLRRVEPLRAELLGFLQAAAGEGGRIVTGKDGLAALALALALVRAGEEHRILEAADLAVTSLETDSSCQFT